MLRQRIVTLCLRVIVAAAVLIAWVAPAGAGTTREGFACPEPAPPSTPPAQSAAPVRLFFPLAFRRARAGNPGPTEGIYGHVTYGGADAPGLLLALRFYDGTVWTTRATTWTRADGRYNLLNVPALAAGQHYCVLYENTVDDPNPGPGYLWKWSANLISSYAFGASAAGGDFDVKDIPLVSPAHNTAVTIPAAFCWTPRGIVDDNYRLAFQNSATGAYAYSPYLGNVSCQTINDFPAAWPSGGYHYWWVEVAKGAGDGSTPYNYGECYTARGVRVSYGGGVSGGASVLQQAAASAGLPVPAAGRPGGAEE